MSSSFGKMITVTVFGQSHSEAIGVVMDGLPAGVALDLERIQAFLDRRAPGKNALSTARKESDTAHILSGLVDGCTCGAPLAAMIPNRDTRSKDYEALLAVPRPMHADYPAWVKYGGHNDVRGGGQFSGRLTAPLCFAGAVALQLLERMNITVGAHIAQIADVADQPFDPVGISPEQLGAITAKPFPVLDDQAGERMQLRILEVKADLDSVGGIIECAITGLPAGIGEPIYDSVESRLAALLFGIPAVRGVEFGAGFAAAGMRGSEHNDSYVLDGGAVKTATNRHGGVLGGITTGMPIVFRTAFKPTPSIAKQQRSVNLTCSKETDLVIEGRHDPCIVQRAVPCVEAAAAITLLDLIVEAKGRAAWN